MSWIQRKVSPSVLEANRKNSIKSTGPKTIAGKRRVGRNAGKYYVFGQVTSERMRELGENPEESEKLRQSLRRAIKPHDGFEEILVEEMAVNRWRLARRRRAETGMLVNHRDRVEFQLRNPSIEGNTQQDTLMIKYHGLVGTSQSAEKYLQILQMLESLQSMVEEEGFKPEGLKILETVYGRFPTVAGTGLVSIFERELEVAASRRDTDSDSQEADQNNEKEGMTSSAWVGSLTALRREIKRNMAYLDAQAGLKTMPLPTSTKDALMTLPEDESERIMKYEAMLQRDFERS